MQDFSECLAVPQVYPGASWSSESEGEAGTWPSKANPAYLPQYQRGVPQSCVAKTSVVIDTCPSYSVVSLPSFGSWYIKIQLQMFQENASSLQSLPFKTRVDKLVFIKGQMVNISSFMSRTVLLTTPQLYCCRPKCSHRQFVHKWTQLDPIKLYLLKQPPDLPHML